MRYGGSKNKSNNISTIPMNDNDDNDIISAVYNWIKRQKQQCMIINELNKAHNDRQALTQLSTLFGKLNDLIV